MPENLTQNEVDSHTDPSVAKQYDNKTPKVEQITDFFKLVDGNKISMLNTYRDGVGMVGRSMAVSKRSGPDILYLANGHSQKMKDLASNKEVQITFQDGKTQDWISVSGTATTVSNSDPRIKEIYVSMIKAWFGDLGDGKHDGGPDDPRMTLIEVKSKYVSYYKKEVGTLGMMKEVGLATVTGKVADTGVLRELQEADLEKARTMS
ncbi:hypothetical protein K458DRAFT_375661 [Lentithecium fluviatile CBS 122367]|uniref:General stress protein FMN-binding split barrel domain-containing protein n=1 Tax=Lentithecium fluviatile CBS 122367 TaxID=1168545 RepID=A0A6G1ILQ1_9PLEO|nr:hypothetical protein K458DRAFT_375661 [Lentithecium fluviatile CBS 122367]